MIQWIFIKKLDVIFNSPKLLTRSLDYFTAIVSISTLAPLGRLAT